MVRNKIPIAHQSKQKYIPIMEYIVFVILKHKIF